RPRCERDGDGERSWRGKMDERIADERWESWWQGAPLFAFVEQRDGRDATHDEPTPRTSWVLDVVRERDYENLLGGGARASREVPFLSTAQIGLDVDGEPPEHLVPFEEGTWHRIELRVPGQHRAMLYRDLDAAQAAPVQMSVLAPPT